MVNINYNDNDSRQKVTMIKNNYLSKVLLFQVYKNLFENNSLIIIIQKGILKIIPDFSNSLWLLPE